MTISNDALAHPDKTLETMTITNSCLAEGTQIQLSNGKLAPIESLRIGQEVFSPYDRKDHALIITDTAKGTEQSPDGAHPHELGRTLLLTEMHPIATPDRGMVQARHLQTGDVVMTKNGPTKLTDVSREPYTGQVYNLKVGSTTELASLGQDQTIVYANDFIVGDGQIQSKYEALAMKQENSRTVEQIPERWRRDYLRSLRGKTSTAPARSDDRRPKRSLHADTLLASTFSRQPVVSCRLMLFWDSQPRTHLHQWRPAR